MKDFIKQMWNYYVKVINEAYGPVFNAKMNPWT